jgi:hypothetical protein
MADGNEAQPLKGGVHQLAVPAALDVAFSSEKQAFLVTGNVLKMDKTVGETDAEARRAALNLPAAAKLGKAGRKVVVTPAVKEQICLLLSLGFSRRQAAAYLGISPTAITNAARREPAMGEEFSRAEELSDLQPQLTLYAEAQQNWKAAAWYLQFRARHPRVLSEEEKEEQHQAQLAERRRQAELQSASGVAAKQKQRRKKVRGK